MPRAETPYSGLADTWGRQNRKLHNKSCAECGSDFRPRRAGASYCSRPCARKKNGGQNVQLQTWWVNSKGYIEGRVLTAQGHRRVKQHRFVMECHLGRLLREDEHVHHRNGVKSDNQLDNLELLSSSQHTREHNSERVYRRGYKLNLSAAERGRRSERMARRHSDNRAAALAKVEAPRG
ncbi:HNH endonuclease [Novosphingobium sp. HII-3]|uniref:HNH endonuclease n=1 Tax=Novosphingobium sp. HII-3 TaxID=2075565 RepID=UPI000CDB8E60